MPAPEVRKRLDGDGRLTQEFIDTHYALFISIARKYCRNEQDAFDLVQDALLVALRKVSGRHGGSELATYVIAILKNKAREHWRLAQRRGTDSDVVITDEVAATEVRELLADGMTDVLRDGLAKLPEDWRQAMLLVYANDLSYKEAASVMGTTLGSLKRSVQEATKRLRGLIPRHLIEKYNRPRGGLSEMSGSPPLAEPKPLPPALTGGVAGTATADPGTSTEI